MCTCMCARVPACVDGHMSGVGSRASQPTSFGAGGSPGFLVVAAPRYMPGPCRPPSSDVCPQPSGSSDLGRSKRLGHRNRRQVK